MKTDVALATSIVALVLSCSRPPELSSALPVARELVELAEAVCTAADGSEACLSKCQVEQRRRAQQLDAGADQ